MDFTPFEHAAIALVCTGIGYLSGDIYAGAAFGAALFIGREHAQAEYRHIERYDGHFRANMPWWGGFDYRIWDLGSILDCVVPGVVVALCVGLYHYFR